MGTLCDSARFSAAACPLEAILFRTAAFNTPNTCCMTSSCRILSPRSLSPVSLVSQRTDFFGFSHALQHRSNHSMPFPRLSPPKVRSPSLSFVRRDASFPPAIRFFRFRPTTDTLPLADTLLPAARCAADFHHQAIAKNRWHLSQDASGIATVFPWKLLSMFRD